MILKVWFALTTARQPRLIVAMASHPLHVPTVEMGDYDCVCESGEKYAVFHGGYDTTMSPTTEPTYMMVRGRRRAAIYGEEMYCEMGNSCIHYEDVEAGFAGGISSYYNCMNLDSWEVYEVSAHFP